MGGRYTTISRPYWSGTFEMFYSRSLPVARHQFEDMSTTQTQEYHDHSGPWKMESHSMATPAVAQRSRPSLADLSTEIIMIILEHLLEIDKRAAADARRVCHRLNDIATGMVYRTVLLNKNITCREAGLYHREALLNISRYTTHLVIPSNLDPYWVRRVIESAERLKEITWRYVKINQWEKWSWRPSHVLDMDIVRSRVLKLHVEDLPVDICGGDLQRLYIQCIPPERLVTLKLGIPTPPLQTQLQALKDLLLQAHNLRTLHYHDRGQGTHFTFHEGERLPPFTDLRLESYDWTHSDDEVASHWDFSRLRSLELVSMPTYPFLSSVCFLDLARLRHLRVEDFSLHTAYRREEATGLLSTLISSHIRELETLDVRVHTALFPISSVLAHKTSLTTLRLRDHTGFGDEMLRVPTLSVDDLATLSQSLSRLETLEVDMDVHLVSTNGFLSTITRFPRLQTLTLHVHTLVDPLSHQEPPGDGTSPSDRDRDREFAYRIFWFLVQARRVQGGEMWREVVVNVGGWQRNMVRRLGEAWKGMNRRGVFGERCFVLRRVGDGDEYQTGEEFGGGLFLGGGLGEGEGALDEYRRGY